MPLRHYCTGVFESLIWQSRLVCLGVLTVNEHHRLLYGMLVAELGVQQGPADKGAVVRGLVPAHVQMVNIHMAQAAHHLHLILDCG